MTDRGPIIFRPAAVGQILRGEKTQTRRIGERFKKWKPGDTAWVRSAHWFLPELSGGPALWHREFGLVAPARLSSCNQAALDQPLLDDFNLRLHGWGRRGPLAMSRWPELAQLRITEIRRQPLREITCDEIRAEGIACPTHDRNQDSPTGIGSVCTGECADRRRAFAAHWDSISRKPGTRWDDNPPVWAITFELLAGGE